MHEYRTTSTNLVVVTYDKYAAQAQFFVAGCCVGVNSIHSTRNEISFHSRDSFMSGLQYIAVPKSHARMTKIKGISDYFEVLMMLDLITKNYKLET